MDGSLNILSQAEKAGVKNFSYASSIITYSDGFMKGDYKTLTDDRAFTSRIVFYHVNAKNYR